MLEEFGKFLLPETKGPSALDKEVFEIVKAGFPEQLTWAQAVMVAIIDLVERWSSIDISRQEIIDRELDWVVKMTHSRAKISAHPQELSSTMQNLRDKGVVRFLDDHGNYEVDTVQLWDEFRKSFKDTYSLNLYVKSKDLSTKRHERG